MPHFDLLNINIYGNMPTKATTKKTSKAEEPEAEDISTAAPDPKLPKKPRKKIA